MVIIIFSENIFYSNPLTFKTVIYLCKFMLLNVKTFFDKIFAVKTV